MFSNQLKQKLFWMVASVATLGVVSHNIDVSSVANAQDSTGFSRTGTSSQASLNRYWFVEHNQQNSGVQISYQSVSEDANINKKYLSGTEMSWKDLKYELKDNFLNSDEVMFGLLDRCERKPTAKNTQSETVVMSLEAFKTEIIDGFIMPTEERFGMSPAILNIGETAPKTSKFSLEFGSPNSTHIVACMILSYRNCPNNLSPCWKPC